MRYITSNTKGGEARSAVSRVAVMAVLVVVLVFAFAGSAFASQALSPLNIGWGYTTTSGNFNIVPGDSLIINQSAGKDISYSVYNGTTLLGSVSGIQAAKANVYTWANPGTTPVTLRVVATRPPLTYGNQTLHAATVSNSVGTVVQNFGGNGSKTITVTLQPGRTYSCVRTYASVFNRQPAGNLTFSVNGVQKASYNDLSTGLLFRYVNTGTTAVQVEMDDAIIGFVWDPSLGTWNYFDGATTRGSAGTLYY